MTKYDSIEADSEAIALTAKDEGDDIKVSCRANKFAVKMLTVVAVIAVVGVVAVRGMTAISTPKMATVDVDQLGGYPCNGPGDCTGEKCCYTSGFRGMTCFPLDYVVSGYCPWNP